LLAVNGVRPVRLQEDQVKQAICDPDRDVREAAVYYFSRSYSQDPCVVPLAIQAIEQHGKDTAFEIYSFLSDLIQTDETVIWLVAQIKKHGQPDEGKYGSYEHCIRSALVHADAAVLERHQAEILDLADLDDDAKKTISERIYLRSEVPEELWRHVNEFCERSDALDKVPDDVDLANNLIEALGKHGEFSTPEVLAILNRTPSDNWLELCAVQLAGELRLQEAIPAIVALLNDADDWIYEEGHEALVKIGGDKLVEELARAYPAGNSDLRLSVASILENIHTDLSVETSRKCFETEEDLFLRGHFLQAMLMNFSTDGIEPARQFILHTPLDPDVLEVRTDLLTACKLLGETFPEFDAWTEDVKNDKEFRKNWYRERSLLPNLDDLELDEGEELDEPAVAPATTVHEMHVGRNDPCPCGSGKKFKKCCLKSRNGSG
jgi:hypothetical protein